MNIFTFLLYSVMTCGIQKGLPYVCSQVAREYNIREF